MTAEEIYMIAMDRGASMTPYTNIRWVAMEQMGGMWIEGQDGPVSIIDALILDRAACTPIYMDAAMEATGWSSHSVASFQKVMLLGHPINETPEVEMELRHWKGIIAGLELYGLVKNRQLPGGHDE